MLANITSTVVQVSILFILMGVGILVTRAGWVGESGAKQLSQLTLYLATPFSIIAAFLNIQATPQTLRGLLLCAVFAALFHVVSIAVVSVLFRGEERARRGILRTGAMMSNCGYMGIPLAFALLGETGVVYLSVYIAVFNIVTWTYGIRQFRHEERLRLKTALINPGTVGLAGGLAIMLLPMELPALLASPIDALASLTTPLAMIVLGYYISVSSLKVKRRDLKIFGALAMKLLVLPLAALAVCYALGLKGIWVCAAMVAACAPNATNILMFASMYDSDAPLAAQMTTYSHLASILTMPPILSLAMTILL